ncbi:hypothetical protein SAMN04489752_2418 [Brevibacterium siliguriense]|uniref:Uncharacterized protein n=1 Tax=Brevibacterium siliguriense TaxID=1136497 RepID=A0A1H1URD1_9MICO|nr:hypothetical protein [Brevibacterium siliguriense]SDS75007.1 hypothetical protein SAMN04489752_2418 [Brevibacterium siliguriense]
MTDVRSDIAALCTIAETAKVHGSPEAVDTALDVLPTLLTGIAAVLDAHQPVLRVFHPVAGHQPLRTLPRRPRRRGMANRSGSAFRLVMLI